MRLRARTRVEKIMPQKGAFLGVFLMGAHAQTQIDDLRFESIEEESVIIFLIFQNMWPVDPFKIFKKIDKSNGF